MCWNPSGVRYGLSSVRPIQLYGQATHPKGLNCVDLLPLLFLFSPSGGSVLWGAGSSQYAHRLSPETFFSSKHFFSALPASPCAPPPCLPRPPGSAGSFALWAVFLLLLLLPVISRAATGGTDGSALTSTVEGRGGPAFGKPSNYQVKRIIPTGPFICNQRGMFLLCGGVIWRGPSSSS